MKKILALSTIVSALSLAHSVNTYTEYKYDNESKVALGSDLKIDFKNITGESKLKFGEFGFENSVFSNFQKNIDFKNEYNLRLNVAKNVDFVGKVKFDVEKRDKTDKINYEIEPAFEIAHKDFKFLLGLNEKGTKETFDTGVKLGVDYAKSGFENKFRLGAWYLTNRERNKDFDYSVIVELEKENDKSVKKIFDKLKVHQKDLTLEDKLSYTTYTPDKDLEYKEPKPIISKVNVPFEISAVDNINYSKGKFETKNEININYLSNDLILKYKFSKTNSVAKIEVPISVIYKEQDNTLKIKVKSENSYKATDTLTPKFNIENEFVKKLASNETKENIKHYEAFTDSLKENSLENEQLIFDGNVSNVTNIKLALNYTKQIDSKNKFSIEPSLTTNISYNFNYIKNVYNSDNKGRNDLGYSFENISIKDRKIVYSLVPKIESTYENKINDNLTFALKPFIELNFEGTTVGGNYNTLKTNREYLIDSFIKLTDNNKNLKESAKKGEKVKYGVTETIKTPFVYNSVKAGAKLELNYTW